MNQHPSASKFKKYEKIYRKATLFLVLLSIILFIIGYMLVQSVTAAPSVIIYLATVVFYYHIVHFLLGFTFIYYYFAKVKQHIEKYKIGRIMISIIFTPISFVIMYGAVFLLTISSCAD